ncbi:MAG TPA: maleylpyruvate isomerase family mycothiol-dependent enzyme [Dehalococcoidia bacterium]|nr:maleylpyruvate isomerase family mycothiol-dependent enzyme [Dehalococcoidia bacterium]
MSQSIRPEPLETVTAIATEAAALESFLAGRPESDLDRPSACSEWTTGEVLAHLTWAATYFGGLIERGLKGDTTPPNLPPPGPARRQAIADAAKRGRAELGPRLRQEFHDRNEALLARLRSIEPADWDTPTAHRAGPIRHLAQTRLNELALHGWDIRSTLEPPGHLTEATLPALIAHLDRWYELLFRPDPAQTVPYRIRFDFAGDRVPARDLVIGTDSVHFEPADGAPDLTLTSHPEVAPLLAYGRVDVDAAITTYGATLSGRKELAPLLRTRFEMV